MRQVRGVPVDYTNLGYDSLRASMLDIARRTLPEWTDHSQNDLGVLLLELVAYASDVTLYYQTRIASQLFPATSDEPDALVQLLRLIGYELRPPSPASVDLAVAVDKAQALPVTIPAGSAFKASASGVPLTFEAVRTVVLTDDVLPVPDGNGRRWFFPVPAVEGTTKTDELGPSDGSPNQLYALLSRPVIARSVEVTVAEPSGSTLWREVASLAESGPADRHFVVRRDASGATSVLFGDGTNGMVPPLTVSSPATVKATYRTGGGANGNVPPNTRFTPSLTDLAEAVARAGGSGGGAAEDLDRARALAPNLYRTQHRAVSAEDYVALALRHPGVGKARAVAANWNDVSLYVAPTGRVAEPPELLVRDLLAGLESARMVTTKVNVRGPEPADVYLKAVVRAEPYYFQSDVRRAVEDAVADMLAFDAIDFGEPVYLSRLYDAAQSLPMVVSLTVTQFSRDRNGGVDQDGVIDLQPFELARPGYDPAILVTIEGGLAQ